MPYKISDQEIKAVSQLSPEKRYEHFVKRIADWEEVWTLKNKDGFVLTGDKEGNEHVPVWPHPKYAELYACEEWKDTKPESIKLEDWLTKWIPGIKKDKRNISVFPILNGKSIIVSPVDHLRHIKEELEKY